jgi:hypothetical protein
MHVNLAGTTRSWSDLLGDETSRGEAYAVLEKKNGSSAVMIWTREEYEEVMLRGFDGDVYEMRVMSDG